MAGNREKAFDIRGFAEAFGEAFDARAFVASFRSAFNATGAGISFALAFKNRADLLLSQLRRMRRLVRQNEDSSARRFATGTSYDGFGVDRHHRVVTEYLDRRVADRDSRKLSVTTVPDGNACQDNNFGELHQAGFV